MFSCLLVVLGFRFCGSGICYFAFWVGVDLVALRDVLIFGCLWLRCFLVSSFNSVVRCWVTIETLNYILLFTFEIVLLVFRFACLIWCALR